MRTLRKFAAVAAGATALTLSLAPAVPASATPSGATTIAVIGDTPYGPQTGTGAESPTGTAFPTLASSINSDPDVSLVVHLGDIKNGSTQCTDAYMNLVKDWFNGTNGKGPGLADPLVYTPGDNEWTDCHRANNGAFVPAGNTGTSAGRLEQVRSTFFATPGQTLGAGAPRAVDTQANYPGFATYVENTKWVDSNVGFGVVHIIGSNNGLNPWFVQAGQTPETAQQTSDRINEVNARRVADLAWIDAIFDEAVANNRAGVFIGIQADMWDPTANDPANADSRFWNQLSEFDAIIAKLAQRTLAFGKPVLLMNGDSHAYLVDNPLDGTNTKASLHPYNPTANPSAYPPVPNLRRVVVPGSSSNALNGLNSWTKLTIDPSTPEVFSWAQTMNTAVPPVAVPESSLPVLFAGLAAIAGLGAFMFTHNRRRHAAA